MIPEGSWAKHGSEPGGGGMSETVGTAGFLDTFRARGAAIADACTRCGDCFRACPMTGPAGIGDADPSATATAIVDLITGGAGNAEAARWSEACSGSGYCIPACKHGINPRCMVQLAGDFASKTKVACARSAGLAAGGAAGALSWCPSCQTSLGEFSLHTKETAFAPKPLQLVRFLGLLAGHADRLAGLMAQRVEKGIA